MSLFLNVPEDKSIRTASMCFVGNWNIQKDIFRIAQCGFELIEISLQMYQKQEN